MGQVPVYSSGASQVALPTQLQQREDPVQKGGRLGRSSGAPARGTNYDHQQSQAGRKKGRTVDARKGGATREDGTPILQQPATCPARTEEQANPGARHFWFSDDSGAAEMRRQVTSRASGIIGRNEPVQVDPGPSSGPPACLPKSSSSRWLCGCPVPKEKGRGMGDSVLRGPAAASPRPGELNTAQLVKPKVQIGTGFCPTPLAKGRPLPGPCRLGLTAAHSQPAGRLSRVPVGA